MVLDIMEVFFILIPQFGSMQLIDENGVQKTKLFFRSNNEVCNIMIFSGFQSKGSRKNKFTELTLRFGPDLVVAIE